MCKDLVIALIFSIAIENGLPPYFVKAIAYEESRFNPNAVSAPNRNGSRDWGVMQINDRHHNIENWNCAETNIRQGVEHLVWIVSLPQVTTYWKAAGIYNAGLEGFFANQNGPPQSSLRYADRVIAKWLEYEPRAHVTTIKK